MSLHRHYLSRLVHPAIEGRHASTALDRLNELLTEAEQPPELYPAASSIVKSPAGKKHSPDFMNHRLKVRQIAEAKLLQLSDDLFKLTDELRYHDPLLAEMLDEAFDSMEAAIERMQSED